MLPVIILLGYTLFSQISSYLMAKYLRNSIPMDHVYMPASLIFYGWFYYNCIDDTRLKKIIKWLTPSLIIFSIINTLFIQHINTPPDNIMKLSTMYNLVWGAILLIQLLDLPSAENVFINAYFLVALAIVWFNIISSFYFFLSSFIVRHKIDPTLVYSLHYYSNYICYLIIFIAMIFLRKTISHVREVRI